MKKYLYSMIFALMAIAAVSFAGSITVQDNGPTTPTTDIRVFSADAISVLMIDEVAATASLSLTPSAAGILKLEFCQGDDALYLSYTDSAGANFVASISFTAQ